MDWTRHLELLPHYVVNLVLVVVAIGILRRFVGDLGVPVELGVVVVVVLAYQTIVRVLGVAPSAWDQSER